MIAALAATAAFHLVSEVPNGTIGTVDSQRRTGCRAARSGDARSCDAVSSRGGLRRHLVKFDDEAISRVVHLFEGAVSDAPLRIVIVGTLRNPDVNEYRMRPTSTVIAPHERAIWSDNTTSVLGLKSLARRVGSNLNVSEVIVCRRGNSAAVRRKVNVGSGLFPSVGECDGEVQRAAKGGRLNATGPHSGDPRPLGEFQGVLGRANAPNSNNHQQHSGEGVGGVSSRNNPAPPGPLWWVLTLVLLATGVALAVSCLVALASIRHPLRWLAALILLAACYTILGTGFDRIQWL